MNKESKKELLFFAKIVVAVVLAALLTAYLAEQGYSWLAGRAFLSFFLLLMWIALIRQIRAGYLRPFYQSEKPRWFAFAKWHHLVGMALVSLGCVWLWFH